MDKNEHSLLSHIPPSSLALKLARPTIKMLHHPSWRIDKLNPTHDLIICLSGGGNYLVGDMQESIRLRAGDAMLIPAYTRFQGTHYGGDGVFTGIAQHFSLTLFDRDDLITRMTLKRTVRLSAWSVLAPLVQHFRATAPHGRTTLAQHHQFMVFLLAFLEEAFVDWRTEADMQDKQDQLSVQIMRVASRLSADVLGAKTEEVLEDVPYNQEYFRRAFRDRIGHTPQKFRELKRMEFAAGRLGMGVSVKAVAAELGYADPYFFSRMFKRYLGTSPSSYKPGGEHGGILPTG
ncbi:helix-turn-helix transcriptional regulator [Shimia sp. NS0008-38b]|uniref:helix-turn-helix domain-containing protein n=1 Tax=Shimia sp. NS0008-38b TaxID=3127653 RepID=UPI003340A81F